jgi:hypothetical protein
MKPLSICCIITPKKWYVFRIRILHVYTSNAFEKNTPSDALVCIIDSEEHKVIPDSEGSGSLLRYFRGVINELESRLKPVV